VFTTEEGERQPIRTGELWNDVQRAAGAFTRAGVRAGDIVILATGHSRALVDGFLGAAAIGAVPAVAPYFTGRLDPALYLDRVARMVAAADAAAAVVSADLAERLGNVLQGGRCGALSGDALATADPSDAALAADLAGDALAYIQFSSGSTGAQKAVAHTQDGMRGYIGCKIERDHYGPDTVVVSWLPLYHDLGLISGLLSPVVGGVLSVLMSPAHWVRDPKILLRAVHDFHGTTTFLPNFALSHCARAVRDRDLEGIDLSSWRRVVLGGEAVRHESLRMFAERFAPYGFDTRTLQAGYGMAENVEAVTATHIDEPARVDWVSRRELATARRAVPLSAAETDSTPMVSCGVPLHGAEVRIAGDDGTPLPDRSVGEILVRSPWCLTGGYYGRRDLTESVFRDGWFLSGDLGYLADGELYVCGRKKDLIIVGGHNVVPDDLETIAGDVPGVASGRVVAFAVPDERMGTDRVVIVCEPVTALDENARRAAEAEIRGRVGRILDVAVGEIRFVERGWVIKTSSGKLARSANREKHLMEKARTA
jgi:acyl-CoA synthetase (AMP-forming)/AMP-acid ligase II